MLGSNNNPNNLREQHFTAHIGRCRSFSEYVLFYEHSIEKLFRDLSEGNGTPDLIAFPLLFLMRHTMELGYKFSLFHLCKLNSSPFSPEAKGGERHSLMELHERLGLEFSEAQRLGYASAKDREEFDEHYSVTEKGMRLFDELDQPATKLRFPNSDQRPVFPENKVVNLLELKNAFDEAMILLDTVVDVVARPELYYW